MKQEASQTAAPIQTQHHFSDLEKIAIEISEELWNNLGEVVPEDTYDIIGIMAEAKNVEQGKIKTVVAMVLAKLHINFLKDFKKNHPHEMMQKNQQEKNICRT